MKRFIQIGGDKELVEKGGWGEWVLLNGNNNWLAKQRITTLRHRIVVGEFIIPADAAVDLFNQDREDGPFIVRIGGADIEEVKRKVGKTTKPVFKLAHSETKKPSQTVVLPDGTTAVAHSWIEFKDGQRFFAHVQIEPRKDVPPPAHLPRGAWWQRAIKRAGELPGTSKQERFSQLVKVCEDAADKFIGWPESDWWIDYLPDDHRNKEKNPRKLMVEFIRDWKTARATNDGRKEFRRKRTMWLMKQVERAQDKAGEGR